MKELHAKQIAEVAGGENNIRPLQCWCNIDNHYQMQIIGWFNATGKNASQECLKRGYLDIPDIPDVKSGEWLRAYRLINEADLATANEILQDIQKTDSRYLKCLQK